LTGKPGAEMKKKKKQTNAALHSDERLHEEIEARIRLEAELKKSLEAADRSRVAMLNSIEERKRADAAANSKSEFLANMSHEIRTPLNAIIGFSELIARTGVNTQQLEYFTKIQRAGRSLLSIINDILDFSKIESGKFFLEKLDFEIDQVLDNVASMVTPQA